MLEDVLNLTDMTCQIQCSSTVLRPLPGIYTQISVLIKILYQI